jgi:UDP-N-acetylglucosamine/UDP-N-acetylgalactosamine diphosphorylase
VARPASDRIGDLRDRFAAHGQDHVFAFWDRLDEAGRSELADQAERISEQLDAWSAGRVSAIAELKSPPERKIAPAKATALPEFGGDPDAFTAAGERGLELLAAGRVGVFVVAGGQGTRLGFSGPKGAFPVGPISERSLFEIQAQKIRGLARRFGRPMPWYVMTSGATDAPTRALFKAHGHFGIAPEDVYIFSQDMVPACDFEGRMILEQPGRIFESPNGHGGALIALEGSGALQDMASRGIDRLFYYQVDNPLVCMADPVFLGFHEAQAAEMSCKVIRKTDPMEKVGVVAQVDDRLAMVEYTELGDAERHARDADQNLLYWAGNIAIHVFNADFIRTVAGDAERLLPYHASAKKIPSVDASGNTLDVDEPNGYKLERFVFDALPAARNACILEVRPGEEFSPIKNSAGTDSPESARSDLVALYRDWLTKAGIGPDSDSDLIEVDHSVIDSADEAAAMGYGSITEAGNVIRVATGMDS